MEQAFHLSGWKSIVFVHEEPTILDCEYDNLRSEDNADPAVSELLSTRKKIYVFLNGK